MSLSANGLANEIMNSFRCRLTSNNAMKAMPELGHAIARYLTKNTSVKYSWSGVMPGIPSIPDPITSYITTQILGDFSCSPTNTLDPVKHGTLLGKQITDGIRKFKIFPAPGWSVPPGDFLCAPNIVLPPYPTNDPYKYWLYEAGVILKFYKKWVKPTPLMGSHISFLAPPGGGATMNQIY